MTVRLTLDQHGTLTWEPPAELQSALEQLKQTDPDVLKSFLGNIMLGLTDALRSDDPSGDVGWLNAQLFLGLAHNNPGRSIILT